jgi:hypothetical protein
MLNEVPLLYQQPFLFPQQSFNLKPTGITPLFSKLPLDFLQVLYILRDLVLVGYQCGKDLLAEAAHHSILWIVVSEIDKGIVTMVIFPSSSAQVPDLRMLYGDVPKLSSIDREMAARSELKARVSKRLSRGYTETFRMRTDQLAPLGLVLTSVPSWLVPMLLRTEELRSQMSRIRSYRYRS